MGQETTTSPDDLNISQNQGGNRKLHYEFDNLFKLYRKMIADGRITLHISKGYLVKLEWNFFKS